MITRSTGFTKRGLGVAALAVLAACSHGTNNPRPIATQKPPVAHGTSTAHILLKVPRAGTSVTRRGRHYISPATQAISINNDNFNVSPTSPNCTQDASTLSCAFDVDAPNLGSVTFTVTTYDAPLTADGGVQGNVLSTGSTTADIQAGQANVVKVTASGVPAQVTLSIANLTPPIGTKETTPVVFDIRDADGYAIVGPYATPVVLYFQGGYFDGADWIDNGSTTFGTAYINQPTDTLALEYTGHGVSSTTIIGVSGHTQVFSQPFAPVPAFGTETPLAIPSLVGADIATTSSSAGQEVWFTIPAKRKLAHIGPASSTVTETVLPSGGTPYHLTPEIYPYDDVLISEQNSANYADAGFRGGKINVGEIAMPAGATQSYQIATLPPAGAPETIVATEPTGKLAVWQWDYTTSKLVLSEVPTGVANSSPAGIVFDSDFFAFTDTGANALGMMDMNKNITYYPLPSAGAAPTRLAIGEGGLMAAIEPGVSKVAFFWDPRQTIQEFPTSGVPLNVVIGQFKAAVLDTNGNLDVFDLQTFDRATYTAPVSPAGPIVAIGFRGEGDAIVLHSNGTSSSIQEFYYF